jgi:hypothetical protein
VHRRAWTTISVRTSAALVLAAAAAGGNFVGLGSVSGMRACGYGSYGEFGNSSAAYRDNVVSWPSVEPADDYSAISLLAFSYGAAGLG